jgi:tetratricopeptide (TPR) repeat protein
VLRDPAFGAVCLAVAVVLAKLGEVQQGQGEKAALASFEQAYKIRARLQGERHPGTLAALTTLAAAAESQGDHTAARAHYEKALTLTREAMGPEHIEVANLLDGLAGTYYASAEYAKAAEVWGRSLEITRKAQGQEATATQGRRLRRAVALARTGAHTAAAVEAEAVAGKVGGGEELFDLGRVYALCAAAVTVDEKLPAEDREKLAEKYTRQALDRLQQAQQGGFFADAAHRERLEKDSDLDSLRKLPEFAALLEKARGKKD